VDAHQVALSNIELWDSTYDKHDAKAISMLFVPGAVFLPPDGSAPRVGPDQIENFWSAQFANIGGHQQLVNKEAVLVNSDTIITVNEYKVGGDPAHGGKLLTGRATSTLVNTPEGWRWASLTPQSH
jgi:ketosteroid isomerase-like protein